MVPITAAIIIPTMLTAVRIITVDIIATETWVATFRQEGAPQEEEQIGLGETNYREMVAIGERRNGSRRPDCSTRLLLPRGWRV